MPIKDQAYHEAAILYNEGLAVAAENLAPSIDNEEVKRWCSAVGKQHRFHEKRHRSALQKILAHQTPETVEQIPDGLDVPEPVTQDDAPTETWSDGCGEFHNPSLTTCIFSPVHEEAPNA